MARFDVVHKWATVPDHLREGDAFRIALSEPLDFNNPQFTVNVLTVVIRNDKLVPATEADARLLEDWKRRHKDTPEWRFS